MEAGNELVVVGGVHPRQRKILLIAIVIGVFVILTLGGVFIAQHLVAGKNGDQSVETDTSTIATTAGADTTTVTALNTDSPTSISNIKYTSYGKSEFDMISNKNFPLDSTLIYNSDDEILYDGYITSINISLYDFFNILIPTDDYLHFVTILDNNILSRWKITPPEHSLFHIFEIPPWELIVKIGSFLCVATDNGDISAIGDSYVIGNKISATQSGKAYFSSNYFSPYDNIQPQLNGENLGIALSFTIVHNPTWNVTTTAPPTTTTTTLKPDTNVSYGSSSDDMLNESIPLNSLFFVNWDDACREAGHIINIQIRFCTPFLSENTLDGFLHFSRVTSYGQILQTYSVKPLNTLLVQSFSVPQWTLILQRNDYLSVGTFSQNSGGNNTICLRRTGNAHSAKNINNSNFQSYTFMNLESRESEMGIALSYVVFSNHETPSFEFNGADLG